MRTISIPAAAFLFSAVIGCGPRIEQISPSPAPEYTLATLEGGRLTGAVISVNGTTVGTALAPAIGDPLKRRDFVVPNVAAASPVQVRAADAVGSDQQTLTVLPSAPIAPNFTMSPPAGTAALGVRFIIVGQGVYPGANIPQNEPHRGPAAHAVDVAGGSPIAGEAIFLSENTYRVRFGPGTLQSGHEYRIRITNDAFYGGQAATSSNSQTVN